MLIFFYPSSRRLNLYLYCFIILFLHSCTEKQDSEIIDAYSEIAINNSILQDTLDISNRIDYVKILKLTDPPSKPLSRIDQLYACGSYYIAIDAVNTKRVNAYLEDGSYFKTLMENGPAEGQALNLTDCYINEKNEVIIYDFAQMKLTIFDPGLSVEKVIQGKHLFHYTHIAIIPGSREFIGYANYNLNNAYLQGDKKHPSSLDILDSKLDLTKKNLTYSSKFEGVSLLTAPKSFFPFKDSLRFFRTYDPYIYDISKNQIKKRYKILYSKGNFPSDFLDSIIAPNLKEFKENALSSQSLQVIFKYCNGYTCPKNWLENDSMIYLSSYNFLEKSTSLTHSLIWKQAKKQVVLNAGIFVDKDVFRLSFPQFTSYDKQKNEFLASCTGNQLKQHLYKGSPLIKSEDIVDDCFYLIKVKFKREQ